MASVEVQIEEVHSHDDHDDHHGNFWTNYIFSTDHKVYCKAIPDHRDFLGLDRWNYVSNIPASAGVP